MQSRETTIGTRHQASVAMAALVALCGACGPDAEPDELPSTTPPNVVIILADDMGYGDLSSYGHPLIRTPNVDRLAAEGQRWTSFYASSPLCNPSRIALATGRMPIRIQGGELNRWSNLPADETTLGDMFQAAGYTTAYIGKWGMSGRFADGGVHPNDAGFDYFYGVEEFNDGGRRPEVPHTYEGIRNATSEDFVFSLFRQEEVIETPTHQPTLTRRYTEESVAWLEQQIEAGSPFFLYLSHTMPHVPIFRSPEFEGHSRAGLYGDVIEELDWSAGEVVAALEEGGVAGDTLVIFSSDNGPWLTYYDLGGSPGPFRDGKHTAWEGGFRVPGIFWWPGTIEPATIDGIGVQVDLMATLAGITGAGAPDRDLDSMDLSGTLLRGEPSPRHEWSYYGTRGRLWAYRVGDHKLVLESWESLGKEGELAWRGFDNEQVHDPPLLFDLSTDLGERFDIAAEHPEIVERIEDAIRAHRVSLNAAP